MKLYRVRWTERHDVDVWARNEDEAIETAYTMDVEKTEKSRSLDCEPELLVSEDEKPDEIEDYKIRQDVDGFKKGA